MAAATAGLGSPTDEVSLETPVDDEPSTSAGVGLSSDETSPSSSEQTPTEIKVIYETPPKLTKSILKKHDATQGLGDQSKKKLRIRDLLHSEEATSTYNVDGNCCCTYLEEIFGCIMIFFLWGICIFFLISAVIGNATKVNAAVGTFLAASLCLVTYLFIRHVIRRIKKLNLIKEQIRLRSLAESSARDSLQSGATSEEPLGAETTHLVSSSPAVVESTSAVIPQDVVDYQSTSAAVIPQDVVDYQSTSAAVIPHQVEHVTVGKLPVTQSETIV